jgi:hypothetical protein
VDRGRIGDQIALEATVVQGGTTPLQASVTSSNTDPAEQPARATTQSVVVPPGEARTVQLGTRRAGSGATIALSTDGSPVAATSWHYGLDAFTSPIAGDVVTVAVGPGGATPYAWLAGLDDLRSADRPGHAAIAARTVIAALPHLDGPERAQALQRIEALVLALQPSPAHYTVGEAAQVVALLAEASPLLGLPTTLLDEFDAQIAVTDATPQERLVLLWARTVAGRSTSQVAVSRQERRIADMSDEERSMLARVLQHLDRADEARSLVAGDGPQAVLARRELRIRDKEAGQRLLAQAPPADVTRPDWVSALPSPPRRAAKGTREVLAGGTAIGRFDMAVGGVVTTIGAGPVAIEGIDAIVARSSTPTPAPGLAQAARLPAATDGLPVRVMTPTPDQPTDDLHCSPCTIAPGESLRVHGSLLDASIPGGLQRIGDPLRDGRFAIRAIHPGTYTVRGVGLDEDELGDLQITVGDGPSVDVAQAVALTLAQQDAAAGGDPEPWLASRPALTDWHPSSRVAVARLRFDHAVASTAAAEVLIDAFEDLREIEPNLFLSFPETIATATAYDERAPERAIDVWRAGVEAAFIDEAGVADQLEPVVGPLAAIQVVREIAARYPALPVVEQAVFDLPNRLADIVDGGPMPAELAEVGVMPADITLMSAAWNREFVALHPSSDLAPQAGLRLVADLIRLNAVERAGTWAERLARACPTDPLLDRMLYLQGLARSSAGQRRRARALFREVSRRDFARADGTDGPAVVQADAQFALARLLEADGDRVRARDAYREVAGDFGDAAASVEVLGNVALGTDSLVLLAPGDPSRIGVRTAGVDAIHARIYRLDLRTVFLRDGGLASVRDLQIGGISPAWSGERSVRDRPYLRHSDIALPLDAPGAYLVQLDAGGRRTATLVVRSDLRLDATDAGGVRRLTVHRRGRVATDVQVRALTGQGIVAARTDVRGVAVVPAFSQALVFDGPHFAFTQPGAGGSGTSVAVSGRDELLDRLDQRLAQLRDETRLRHRDASSRVSAYGVRAADL